MANSTNLSCSEAAQAYIAAKSAAKKRDLVAYIAEKAKASGRVRWERLRDAIAAKDTLRVAAYAATGEAKSKAWAAVKAAETPAPKPKASKPKAKAKPAKQAEPAGAMDALASALDGMDADALAAFLTAYVAKRNA